MNKRIKELANKAGMVTEADFASGGHFAEKFAELFLKECEKVISDGRYSDMACEGNSHRVSYNNGRYGASLDVKKHFGVAEE